MEVYDPSDSESEYLELNSRNRGREKISRSRNRPNRRISKEFSTSKNSNVSKTKNLVKNISKLVIKFIGKNP